MTDQLVAEDEERERLEAERELEDHYRDDDQ